MLHVVITDESVWTWKGHRKVSTFEKVPIHYGHLSLIISLLTTDSFKTFKTDSFLIFYRKQH